MFAALAGCLGGADDARAALVPYPHLGDVAVYDVSGSLIEFARWENGIPLASNAAQVRFTLDAAGDALDGARAVHPTFKVTTEVAEASVFVKRSERYVSPRHEAVVQSFFPLSQDQSIVAFDERGLPWLFGASALIGEEIRDGASVAFEIPDNLGRAKILVGTWNVIGRDEGLWKLELRGLDDMTGALWMEDGSSWPARVELALTSDALAPHVRSDGGYPVSMSARRASFTPGGGDAVPPRDRGATFAPDTSAVRAEWDREMPPDGDATALSYALSDAARDAKLLDKPLADWLAAASEPILYRATFQIEAGPIDSSTSALWLLQWVDQNDAYYEVQIAKVFPPNTTTSVPSPVPLPVAGVPVIESSGPAEAPADPNHGWWAPESVPSTLVPLSEGMRIVRDVFGATDIQIFLRSFTDPPGYSYFLDGGFEEGGPGRYTVIYNPNTGFIEEATGPVAPRLSPTA